MSVVAVTDANIFIDLFKMELVALLFRIGMEVHTTREILNELYKDQQATLLEFEQLKVHDLSEEQWREIEQLSFSRRFSEADQSVLGLAYLLRATILTNEKLMRRKAGQWGLEVHGILWLLESFVNGKMLSPQAAAEKLEYLMRINIYLPQEECKIRLEQWGGGGDGDSRS
jgi:predicted nucleic acid-binding protein